MNALEQQLTYPMGETLPPQGRAIDVAEGVRWLRMPLPFALDHINLWLLRDEQDGVPGWTIVDCGVASDTTREAWQQVFEGSLDGLPVQRLIVTHMHPDHIGLAEWLTQRWGVRLWISATDWNAARMASTMTTGFGGDAAARFMASHGLTDPDSQEKIRRRSNYYASMVPKVPAQFRRLMDGDILCIGGRDWTCLAGYGHAPEHMSLHCPVVDGAPTAPPAPAPMGPEGARRDPGGTPALGAALRPRGALISGDMVLPRISTNVSVIDLEPEANPLPLYLRSIERLRALPEQTLVLPSHGRPFRGLHTRIDQLKTHHDERFAEVLAACSQAPQAAADLLQVLFKRKLDLHQTTFAMGEAIAHLHKLWMDGRLRREFGADGVIRFATL